MKAISLKRLALHQFLPEEERLLNNFKTIQLKKAGFITCLFLWTVICHGQEKAWLASEKLNKPYALILNLQLKEARKLLSGLEGASTKSPEHIYIASLADALELMITEDDARYDEYQDAYEKRIDQLEEIEPASAASLFASAELRLQWAFVYLKFGHEFDAAWNIRQAYLMVQECKERFPGFIPIKKTSGLLEVMLGSVPEKYQWVMNLLNMEGSVGTGLEELKQVIEGGSALTFETTLLYHLFEGFVLQQTESSMSGFNETIKKFPENRLGLFLGASMAIKNSQSEKALTYLQQLSKGKSTLAVPYADYQLGEVYLHKGEYESSILAYQKFIVDYRGQNFIKDAHYKIGVCYWLNGNSFDAKKYFEKAKAEGKESAEADKYAARQLLKNTYPNVKLSKLRYATDGGYYDEAKKIISSVNDQDFTSDEQEIEFVYRKARLFHKLHAIADAQKSYVETITKQGEENWYFAPNACLQLGYLFLEQHQSAEAKKYFEKALTYKKHEYKNSIDSKAKSALAQLKKSTP
jgi:tetratricopeptide (TPR) repeat protein